MADKKNNKNSFNKFLGDVKQKRLGESSGVLDFLTVQQLSKEVEGKVQKYNRIGPLMMVKFGRELTLNNIKNACEEHFTPNNTNKKCDILAGERGPSFTEMSQIKKFDPLHIRFIDCPQTTVSVVVLFGYTKILIKSIQ